MIPIWNKIKGQATNIAYQINDALDNFSSVISKLLPKDGSEPMTGNLDMNGYSINNVGTISTLDGKKIATEEYVNIVQNNLDNEIIARQNADASIQAQISNTAPLEASAFSPISWHDQIIQNSVFIPDNKNAWSFGPTITIAQGQSVTIGNNSYWTIANGQLV